jgi:hypothetical protein
MAGLNGIDTGIQIRQAVPDCKVILFSGQAATKGLLDLEARQDLNSNVSRSHCIRLNCCPYFVKTFLQNRRLKALIPSRAMNEVTLTHDASVFMLILCFIEALIIAFLLDG